MGYQVMDKPGYVVVYLVGWQDGHGAHSHVLLAAVTCFEAVSSTQNKNFVGSWEFFDRGDIKSVVVDS